VSKVNLNNFTFIISRDLHVSRQYRVNYIIIIRRKEEIYNTHIVRH